MHLSDPNHVHGDACFIDIEPLSIVELYQSQGCKSCPPAVPLIHKATDNPNLLLLSYDVTYWDHLGWNDTFGDKRWDQRQRAYVTKWGRTGIYTPHVVVDGVSDGTGGRTGEVSDIISKARESQAQNNWSITLSNLGSELKITSDRSEAEVHDVLLVKYEPTTTTIKIGKGPNKGKKVPHRNIVKDVSKIGEWHGGETIVPFPPADQDGTERVVIVQGSQGGPIVAAEKI